MSYQIQTDSEIIEVQLGQLREIAVPAAGGNVRQVQNAAASAAVPLGVSALRLPYQHHHKSTSPLGQNGIQFLQTIPPNGHEDRSPG